MSRHTLILLAALGAATPLGVSAQDRPYLLEGLVVTASPTPRPADAVAASVTVLEGDDLRARGLLRVADALREIPGVSVVQGGSYGAVTSTFLRGGESDYVLVLVDGVQVNQPGGAFDFSTLNLANVERVEILRGPASALYGSDAVAGVIHVITRTGADRTRGSVSTGAGTYGRVDASAELTGGGDRAGFSFGLAHTATDGILPFNNRHVNTVLSGALVLRPDDATAANLTVRMGERRYHYPTDGSGAVVDSNAFSYGDEVVVGLRGSRRVGDRLAVQATFGVSDSDGGTDDAQDGPGDTSGSFGYVSLDAVRRASADIRLDLRSEAGVTTLGVEWEGQRQRSFSESLSEWGNSADRSEYSRWNRAVYAHVTGEREVLAYNAGGRVEDNQRFGRFVTWQAGAALRLGEDGRTRLRASAGTAIKEPTFYENYATGFALGNPHLEPERSLGLEAGVERELAGGRARVSATLFQQRFQDLIQYTFAPATSGDPNFYNVAEARARGLELEAWAEVGPLSLTAAWARLDSEVLNAGFDEGPGATFVQGEALVRRPANTLALRASAALGRGTTLSAGATMVGTRSDRNFSTWPATPVELDAHTDVSVGADVPVLRGGGGTPRLTLTFRGDNLLDSEYEEAFGFRAPGRAVFVGARVTFGGS